MTKQKNTPMTYKHDKDKIELSGEGKDVKSAMWFDLITHKLGRLIRFVLLPLMYFVPPAGLQ
jgi:hypothetical protein